MSCLFFRSLLVVLGLLWGAGAAGQGHGINTEAAELLSGLTKKPFYASDGWVDLYKTGAVRSGDDFYLFEKGVKKTAQKINKNTEAVMGAGVPVRLGEELVIRSWSEAVKAVDDLIKPQIKKLKGLYPDAKMGYRGSLATGKKYSTGGPFDPLDWDVDAFIVSDELAKKIGGTRFRDGKYVYEVNTINQELEPLFKNISGYRTEVGKPFTFRVWTEVEFIEKVKPFGYKLFE
jgi:filamentous hemagglutinin